MNAIEIVKEIMRDTGKTNAALGNALNRNADVVNKRLKQKDLTAGVLAEMLFAMGYKVVVMKADEKTPKEAKVIDAGRIGNAGGRKAGE